MASLPDGQSTIPCANCSCQTAGPRRHAGRQRFRKHAGRSAPNTTIFATELMTQYASTLELEPAAARDCEMHLGDIAVVMPVFKGGGAQRDMILLCNAISAKGIPISIVVLRNEGPLRCL